MPAADRPAFARVLTALALLVGGCTVEATGIKVTVRTSECVTDALVINVLDGAQQLATRTFAGPIPDGATFGIRLSDGLDGRIITIEATGSHPGLAACHESRAVHVIKQRAVDVDVDVGECCPASGDGGIPDMTGDLTDHPDLAVVDDLSVPDLSDMTVLPDFLCAAACVNGDGGDAGQGAATVCVGGKALPLACSFGLCSGADCPGPNSCDVAGDISTPGTYFASTVGANSTAVGNVCADLGESGAGPDNTLKFGANQWGTWTLALDASFSADFFTRLTCNDPATLLVMSSACGGLTDIGPACFEMTGKVTQKLCGLPPNQTYYSFVKDPGGLGGWYQLTSSFKAVDLNTCPTAGMLPGPSFSWSGDTSAQVAKNEAAMTVMNCSDRGHKAPEMVFWVPVLSDGVQTLTVNVTGKGNYQPLVYAAQYCVQGSSTCGTFNGNTASWRLDHVPAGAWYIFVDGQDGSMGQFDLTMTLQ